jgi:hypothetical protein
MAAPDAGAEPGLSAVLAFLRALCAADGVHAPIGPDTPLFDDARVVDSKRMVDLLAYVERLTGAEVPDHLLSAEHFGTPRAIARSFCAGPGWPALREGDLR